MLVIFWYDFIDILQQRQTYVARNAKIGLKKGKIERRFVKIQFAHFNDYIDTR